MTFISTNNYEVQTSNKYFKLGENYFIID